MNLIAQWKKKIALETKHKFLTTAFKSSLHLFPAYLSKFSHFIFMPLSHLTESTQPNSRVGFLKHNFIPN